MTDSTSEPASWVTCITAFIHIALWTTLIFVVMGLAPGTSQAFRDFNMKLPALTQLVLSLTKLVNAYPFVWMAPLTLDGGVIAWLHFRAGSKGKLLWLAVVAVGLLSAIAVVSLALLTPFLHLSKGLSK